jgi:HAD superfamily hydrolase (TIGR01509 family)
MKSDQETRLPDRRQLVIFDCDGVLVDSEPISNGTFVRMLNEIGFVMSEDEGRDRFVGKSITSCIKDVEEALNRKLGDEFEKEFRRVTFEKFEKELTPVKGIREVLSSITHHTCVASSGPHEKIKLTLGVTGLYPFFEGRIYSAVDVGRGKPFPDLFLHAAKQMDFEPEQCIVVEDAVPGVQAAIAAGMRVLGYAELASAEKLAKAGAQTFTSMSELLSLLR